MFQLRNSFKTTFRQNIGRLGGLAAFLTVATWVAACQVPVFRYAIERWVTDKYEVVLIQDGTAKAVELAHLDRLRTAAGESTNVTIRSVDIQQSTDAGLAELWKKHGGSGIPVMAILYPQGAREVPDRLIYACPIQDSFIDQLFISPARQEISKRLEAGQSAVWVFVASGNAQKDEPALQVLNRQLLQCQKSLTLPALEELDITDAIVHEKASQMRIEFSTVTVAHDDQKEQFLRKILMASEDDLATCGEPLAFPVFGRGRVLYALVGKGINDEMILRACQFVVGPCSCQVKAQNPGFDLLMSKDWEKAVGDVMISDPLPDTSDEPVFLKIPTGRATK